MSRRLFVLVALAILAVALAGVGVSLASLTSTTQTTITATTDGVGDWLHLYSQPTDPDGLTGYALRRVRTPPAPLAASGQDAGIAVDLGGFPDTNDSFDFSRVITIKTPLTFPSAGVTQVAVTVTTAADPASRDNPLKSAKLSNLNGSGANATVTLGPNQKRQLNLQVRARKQYALGQVYYPRVIITLTYAGGPAGYYRYEFPVAVTDAGF